MQKGKTNNPNGRPKGVPNKLTGELRNILKAVMADEIQRIPEYLESLPPSERLAMLVKLLPYVCPKVESVNMSHGEPWDMSMF